MPKGLHWALRAIVLAQIGIVTWDTLALRDAYGLRRVRFDGLDYLAMAHSLRQGEALRSTPLLEPQPYRWIGEWPLGYPALIAVTSTITSTEPFHNSRWLNLFCYIGIYLLLLWIAKPIAEILFLAIWPPNMTWTVGFVLSENPFMFFFTLLIGIAKIFFTTPKILSRHRYGAIVGITLLLWVLFLVRYAGVGVGAAAGLTGLWLLLRHRYTDGILWIGAAVGQGLFAVVYFTWNSYHDPTGEGGLTMREMPAPPDLFAQLLPQMGIVYYVGAGAALALLLRVLWAHSPRLPSTLPYEVKLFLGFSGFAQLVLYAVSMLAGRVGIVDMRHFWPMLLPICWLSWEYLLRVLPGYLHLGVGIALLLWQGRNTYRHARQRTAAEHLPYSYIQAVVNAYDTLPPHTCIAGGSRVYALSGKRLDLAFVGRDSYWPVLLRRCTCLYVDCALLAEKVRIGASTGMPWPFVRYCSSPCARDTVCLRRVRCANSK